MEICWGDLIQKNEPFLISDILLLASGGAAAAVSLAAHAAQ